MWTYVVILASIESKKVQQITLALNSLASPYLFDEITINYLQKNKTNYQDLVNISKPSISPLSRATHKIVKLPS